MCNDLTNTFIKLGNEKVTASNKEIILHQGLLNRWHLNQRQAQAMSVVLFSVVLHEIKKQISNSSSDIKLLSNLD